MIIGAMPATNAAGMAAARSDITVETSSITTMANACAFGSLDWSSATIRYAQAEPLSAVANTNLRRHAPAVFSLSLESRKAIGSELPIRIAQAIKAIQVV